MKNATLAAACAGVLAFTLLASAPAHAGPYTDPLTIKGAIKGRMNIDFQTRTRLDQSGKLPPDSPALGAKDIYAADLEISESIQAKGNIERQPWLPSATLGTTVQVGHVGYALKWHLKNPANPAQTIALGGWVGAMNLDGSGIYHLANPPEGMGEMRIAVDSVGNITGFVSKFEGKIQGRVPKQAGLIGLAGRASRQAAKTFSRVVDGRVISHTVKGADPMSFQGVALARGALSAYPETRVTGSVDYDAEEGIWYVDLRAAYSAEGASVQDRLSGTIRWNEDPARKTNGLGHYEVNVRVNEKEKTEAAAFAAASEDENAFFAADVAIPGFTGRINYVDTFEGDTVTASKVTYAVDANKVSKIQTMTFAKILLLMVGPFNDE